MTHAAAILHAVEDRSLRRWIGAAALVILLHAGVIYWLTHKQAAQSADSAPPAVMIELEPLEVASASESVVDITPGPQMTEAQPEEVEPPETLAVTELPPAPKPAVVLMTAPKAKLKPKPKKIVNVPPKPIVKRTHEPPAPRTSAPVRSASPVRSADSAAGKARASAARQGISGSSMSASNWRSLVAARLNQHKPGTANQSGVVSLFFTINRSGQVVAARVNGSSGSAALDHAALAMVHAVSPLPPPPPEISGGSISLTVPVRFH
jgi:protein TonB